MIYGYIRVSSTDQNEDRPNFSEDFLMDTLNFSHILILIEPWPDSV